ncbi:MAG: hypothetical protein HY763_13675 [Planctomycetes bacterium]|nr:hypothetical protein [Planctomycetota bacterium]
MLRLLTLEGLYRFGRLFGSVEWLINYKRRRRFAAALERVLGRRPSAAEHRRATREYFQQTRCDKLFYLIVDCLPRTRAVSLYTINGREAIDRAVARGRGVYVALSHHGPHHVAAMLMTLCGYKVAGVRDRQEGGIRRYMQARWDRRFPELGRMRVLYADSYPRDLYRCFQDGYVVGSAMDVSRVRHPNQKTEKVTVFGETRAFLSGPLRVAIRCGVPVVQGFIVPERGFRYRLEIVQTLFDPANAGEEDAAVRDAMRQYAANVERYVRNRPVLLTRV